MKIQCKNRNRKNTFLIFFAAMSCLGTVLGVLAYSDWKPAASQDDLRMRVSEIIRESLERGTGNINGVSVYTKLPIRSRLIEEIRAYGDKVVPILADHLNAENQQERLIAVNLLGEIGRATVVPYLGKVIRDESSAILRIVALRWISCIDDQSAREIIIEASEKAYDEKVREEALHLRERFKIMTTQ